MVDIPGVAGSVEQATASDAGIYESRRHLLKPVTVDAFKGLVISDLRAYADGKLAEGVFTLANGTAANMPIAAKTVFATGLDLAPNKTYTAHEWGVDNVLTLEVDSTGESVSFTTDIEIPASSSLTFYVVANDGA